MRCRRGKERRVPVETDRGGPVGRQVQQFLLRPGHVREPKAAVVAAVVAVVENIVFETTARQVVARTGGVVRTARFLLVVGGGVILPGGGGERGDFTVLETVEFVGAAGKDRAAPAETGGGLHAAS